MLRIIKPQNINKLNEKISIPDIQFEIPSFEFSDDGENDDNEELKISRDLYKKLIEKAKVQAEYIQEKMLRITNEERKKILEDAQNEAMEIQQNAYNKAESILKQAEEDYEQLTAKATQEGLRKGIEGKSEAIAELIEKFEKTMSEMKESQLIYMQDYAKELKWLSLEIAEKIISHKMDENDLVLMEIIKSALKGVRDTKWITVQISEELPKLVETVIKEISLNDCDTKIEVQSLKDVDKGTCIIQLADRVIDVSVLTQIKNIEEYFKESDGTVYAE